MCATLMGPGADSTTGRTMLRGLRRSIRDMAPEELHANLVEIRDSIQAALNVYDAPHALPAVAPLSSVVTLSSELAHADYDRPTSSYGE